MKDRSRHRRDDGTALARRVATAVVFALVALLLTAGPAAAHAELVSTDPPAGAQLSEAPEVISVTFNETVQAKADAVRLYDARGDRVETGQLRRASGGKTLQLAVGDISAGAYVVTWRVVSTDGHPINGGVTWRVGAVEEVDSSLLEELLASDDGSEALSIAGIVARTLLFAGMAALIGGAALMAVAWPAGVDGRRARRVLAGAWVAVVIGTIAGLGVQAADIAGRGLGDAVRPSVVADVFDTDYGRAGLARLVLLLVAGAILTRLRPGATPSRQWLALTSAVGIGLLTTITFSGHARTGRWIALAGPVDVVHLAVGALWVGGLAMLVLAVMPAVGGVGALETARRFSPIALVAVVVVSVTGTVQGLRQLDGLDGLLDTSYGRLLLAKVVGVTAMVVLGWSSRQAARATDADAEPSVRLLQLRQSVIGEVGLAVAVLVATALLVSANPARSAEAEPFNATRVLDGTVLEVIVTPASTGPVDVHVYVQAPQAGLTGGAQEATATLSLPDRDIDGVEVPLLPVTRNHFSAYAVEVPIKGEWILDVVVRVGELESRQARFTVPID